jgi:hypothetical protein
MRLLFTNAAILETLKSFLVLDFLLVLLRIFLPGMERVMGCLVSALRTILEWQQNRLPMIRASPVWNRRVIGASGSLSGKLRSHKRYAFLHGEQQLGQWQFGKGCTGACLILTHVCDLQDGDGR